jgi:hypothetical protein
MASDRLADEASCFNQSSGSSDSFSQSEHLAALSEEFSTRLLQMRALIAVAQHGLFHCSESQQFHFLLAMDEIAGGNIIAYEEIRKL